VRDLSLGERQKVEIIKLLMAKAEFLIFDEAHERARSARDRRTDAGLPPTPQDGLAVLFITHKLR